MGENAKSSQKQIRDLHGFEQPTKTLRIDNTTTKAHFRAAHSIPKKELSMRLTERKPLPTQTSEWEIVQHSTLRTGQNRADLRLHLELRSYSPMTESTHSATIAKHCETEPEYKRFQGLTSLVHDKEQEISEAKREAAEVAEAIELERGDLLSEGSVQTLSSLKHELQLCHERVAAHERDLVDIRDEWQTAKTRLKQRAMELTASYRLEAMAQLRESQASAMEKLQSTANEALDELATANIELQRVAALANQGFEIMQRIGVTENE
jgi:hypothetical protein